MREGVGVGTGGVGVGEWGECWRGFLRGFPAGVGEFPQRGQQAGGGALLEVEGAVRHGEQVGGGVVVGQGFFGGFDGVICWVSCGKRFTELRHRAEEALRVGGGADLRAEFHDGVGVEAGFGVAGELGGFFADGFFRGREWRGDAEEAAYDALDVAIHHHRRCVEGGGGDDGGGVRAEAGEGEELGFRGGKAAVVLRDDGLGAGVEEVGAAVVAEALPEVEDLLDVGLGEGLHGGKGLEKALVVGDDRGDGGLLEHDFRQPNVVGAAVGFFPPRHGAVAAGVPGQQDGREILAGGGDDAGHGVV